MRVDAVGAVTGWAALRLYGAAFFDGLAPDGRTTMPVPLVSPHHLADTADSITSRASLAGHRLWVVQGVRCVGVERAVVDEIARVDDLREAVVVIDMACAARITSLARIRSYAERHPRARALVLSALALASEHSLSPQETRMRLVWVLDAGWPEPACNRTVYAPNGQILGRPDLLDMETGVVGEYNGAFHRGRARHRSDVGRAELFRSHGLQPFEVVAGDGPEVQIARMRSARERALGGATPRRWTTDPPPGALVPAEMSVDEELDLHAWPAD